MARWKVGESTTFEISPLLTCTLCQERSYISNGIEPIFEILASARRCWGWAYVLKISGEQIVYFCNSKVKTFCMYNIWNFLFSTCTLSRQEFCISRGIQPIFEIFASARRCWGWEFDWQVSISQVFYLQWQGETFVHRQHLKFCHFQPVQCPSKNPVSPKVFNRFSKSLPQLEDFEGGHLGGKFQVRRYCTFAMARWKLSACKTFEVSLFQPVHCPGKNSVSPRAFNQFSKSFPHFDDVEGGHLTGKFQVRRYCTFAMSRWKLSACTTFEISLFQPVHCPSKNPISPKVFNRFSKSLPQLEDFEGGHLGGKFQARRYFTFAMARWELCACTTFEISHFQSVPCHSKNSISPKVFHRFSKSLPQLEDFEGGQYGGKFQARSYFTFAMASWNLCLSTTFETLPLSTCTMSLQKSYISTGIQPIFKMFGTARRFWGWAFG